ncbi:MAG: hypothetical protein WCP39_04630 [Chlamydiota bacterium]
MSSSTTTVSPSFNVKETLKPYKAAAQQVWGDVSSVSAVLYGKVKEVAAKVSAFVQKHPYLFLAVSIGLSLVTMSPWIHASWAIRMVVYGALETVALARFVLTAQIFWKMFKKEGTSDLSRSLLILTALSNVALLAIDPHWAVFDVAASTGAALGTVGLSQFFSPKTEESAGLEMKNLGSSSASPTPSASK